MKTSDFLRQHDACRDGAKWALSISNDMADVWEAMIEQGKHEWLMWASTRPGVFPSSALRKLACRFVRETPLLDGRKVWDLLIDERSRNAVAVAERYADGKETEKELADARNAALAAAHAARSAARAAEVAAYAAAYAAYGSAYVAYAARSAAAYANYAAYAAYGSANADADAAYAAQIEMIAELCNPFGKRRN